VRAVDPRVGAAQYTAVADRLRTLPVDDRPTVCGINAERDRLLLWGFGACDARITRGTDVETIHCEPTGQTERAIRLPFDNLAVAADFAAFTDSGPQSDLRSGVVPGAGFRLRAAGRHPAQPAHPAFEAISLVAPVIEDPRPPLPTIASGSDKSDSTTEDEVRVTGFLCSRGHFNSPDASYCAVCGISMVMLTRRAVEGARPPLGYLVRDDGATFLLDGDYVIGRSPEQDADVGAGRARPLVLADADRSVSRTHAAIVLDGWNVLIVDRHSANGTFVSGPSSSDFQRVQPDQPLHIRPGTRIRVGRHTLVFDSHFKA
jgi:hypothetical protein